MADPVLVEVTRGALVESRHRGAVAVVDAEGGLVLSLGDLDQPVFPRSAVKALQVLPLVAEGHADRFGLSAAEIALACASHSGEPAHVATATAMLAKAGREPDCLECGAHWPLDEESARTLVREGARPGPIHNNCSGKHAGFVCLACGLGTDPAGYVLSDHPVQGKVRAALEELTGSVHSPDRRGTDGCSIPTYAVPLPSLAYAFARFGAGVALGGFADAAKRVRAAVAENPAMVAGRGRFDTRVMEALRERVFVKTGAEGVHCAALPELGLGLAVKCDDGAKRGAEAVMASLVLRFLPVEGEARALLEAAAAPRLRNWNGIEVGAVRPAGPLTWAGRA
ncbi:MAG TPA: asparaginase [Beijerinckiaceae bacterium]|nr:asparaginase [Beijerinckiaceae bacterium]